ARESRPRADAAYDQHLHAGRQTRSGRDHRFGEKRPLCRKLRRRPGRHHLGQIRVPMHRGLQNREWQSRRVGERRHADRQWADRLEPHHHDRQRLRARSRDRHLRQERPGRSGRRRPAEPAHGSHHRGWDSIMATVPHNGTPSVQSRIRGWTRTVFDIAVILLLVTAAKTAIAEPYYVPSGSMEPTLLIGDELLATKFPYGYGSSSLPAFIDLPATPHILGALPRRGDIVVFRWPGDRSQIWVKRVIGLPGDRIALRDGRVSINGTPVGVQPDGTDQAENEDGSHAPAARFIETL